MDALNSDSLPAGFQFAAMAAGIKKSGKLDLSLIATDTDAVGAGVYTQNLVHATSIDWCRHRTPSAQVRGVVVNSGNANACTGQEGQSNNRRLAELAADFIGCHADQILVLSTGVIGQQLPMPTIEAAWQRFPTLQSAAAAFLTVADGITTTDHSRKVATGQFQAHGRTYRIAAMAKGAGMIGPNMATMLGIVLTDYPLDPASAHAAIRSAADHSFNRISVEGHTSTNDALLLLSSQTAPHTDPLDASYQSFVDRLREICLNCAKLIPADGEGATHLLNLHVRGTDTDGQADQIARCVANSALVKCAIHGNDPNWGRIVSAAGYAGVPFDPQTAELRINGHLIFAGGCPQAFNPRELSQSMKSSFDVLIQLSVGSGPGQAVHYTSDLTVDYVKFNSEYTT
jgi:glutamate N-acetyltransferase/amino-acid N-acetyltransferase